MPYCRNCGNQLQEADNFCETCGTAKKGASSKTSFTGKTCPFCQFPIKQGSNSVVCAECCSPHHRECWQENTGCTTYGCRGIAYWVTWIPAYSIYAALAEPVIALVQG